MEGIIKKAVAKFIEQKEDIIKESLLEVHHLEPTKENFKRITRVFQEGDQYKESYYLDSAHIAKLGELDEKNFVASFESVIENNMVYMKIKTPFNNSKYKNE